MDHTELSTAESTLRERHLRILGWTGLGRARRPRIVMGGSLEEVRSVGFVPLLVGEEALGVLRLDGPVEASIFASQPERLLEAFAREAALSLQRVRLAQEAAHADVLRQADAMKSALLASVSHDLRTPLAGITAAVSSLNDRSVAWSDADRDAFLRAIETQARLLDSIIGDILSLSRIESGAISPSIESVPVVDMLAAARERTAIATQGRDVSIDADATLEARTDESLIVQAIANLIENAAKYSSPGGAIRLSARSAGSDVEVSVQDSGPGIAPEDMPHLFERFYRGQAGARKTRGSGLGLAIVQGFVTLSGGAVKVETSATGTCFTLTLPAGKAAVPA
jgi:two-component system sensor histidine kinase KdpD